MDRQTRNLIQKTKNIPLETLLSWAGYSSKYDFEDDTDCKCTRENLVETNFEDIEANLFLGDL